MVFTTALNLIRSRGPDEFWRKRKIFRLAAHYVGRRRNCYSVAIKIVHRALVYATKGRKLRKQDVTDLREVRVNAGCEEHGLQYKHLKEGLARNSIMLNLKSLADLAAWEPYSFKALTDIAKRRVQEDGVDILKDRPINAFTKTMKLKK